MARLLVLDNDARIVELVALYLAQRGHQVRTAGSFREARRYIVEETPELLLSDLELGAESGREALPELWRAGLLPPTLVVSGYVDEQQARVLAAIPAVVGTLAKPFAFEALEAAVAQALTRAAELRGTLEAASRVTEPVPAQRAADADGWVEILPPDRSA